MEEISIFNVVLLGKKIARFFRDCPKIQKLTLSGLPSLLTSILPFVTGFDSETANAHLYSSTFQTKTVTHETSAPNSRANSMNLKHSPQPANSANLGRIHVQHVEESLQGQQRPDRHVAVWSQAGGGQERRDQPHHVQQVEVEEVDH